MSDRKGNEAKNRAYDHYRWAERYSRYGEDEKAKAHMRRAVHYGKAAFGAGDETGAEPMQTDDHNVNVIFVLSPLNETAVGSISSAINDSIEKGQRVEVYMQAFSKPEWKGVFNAGNLLPMNFNQYSSDDPFSLVRIAQNFQEKKLVTFYIFPTQTTKNATFNNKCVSTLGSLMQANARDAKIDEWMNAAIISWGIRNTKDEKGEDVVAGLTFQDVIDKPATYFQKEWSAAPVFDPFCVYWAVNNELRTRAEWPIKAHPTKVGTATHEGMEVPDFTETMHHAQGDTNCFYVLWDMCQLSASNEGELKKKVESDAENYINAIWESFKHGTRPASRRKILNMLIVQDYYDYDNKMSVWYALYMFEVTGAIELLSITRPVADRATMIKMRKKGGAFEYSRKAAAPKPAKVATSEDKWPAAPVITKENFNEYIKNMVNYDGPTFEQYQKAIDPRSDEAQKRSSKEAEEIAEMWRAWLSHFYATRTDLKPTGGCTCTNGGYTNRHGMNPAVHTLMEDWFKGPIGHEQPGQRGSIGPEQPDQPEPKRIKT